MLVPRTDYTVACALACTYPLSHYKEFDIGLPSEVPRSPAHKAACELLSPSGHFPSSDLVWGYSSARRNGTLAGAHIACYGHLRPSFQRQHYLQESTVTTTMHGLVDAEDVDA